jgi:hypothetical protein
MRTIPIVRWIANAAARFAGPRGAVTQRAQLAGCSRQCIYCNAQKVKDAVEAEHSGQPGRAKLLEENASLRRAVSELWDWLFQTIEFPQSKQHEFTVTALAMGFSHTQVQALMAILLGANAAPSRSTIHRWTQIAETAAGQVLEQLDRSCKPLVREGCLDEIFFHRRPTLVGIEPRSMMWFLGRRTVDHHGSTWFNELRSWTSLCSVISDAGSGLKAGLTLLQRCWRSTNQIPLVRSLDVFHTKREAQRVLSTMWQRVEHCWERAEQASRTLRQAQWHGRSSVGLTRPIRVAWEKATRAFELYEKREAVWKRAELALNVFRSDGSLNDRTWAEKEVAWAVPRLPGSTWSKVRRLLQSKESFTFLDQLHKQLGQLLLPEALREGLVHLWWLRRQRSSKPSEAVGGYDHVASLVQQVLVAKMDPNWHESYRRVGSLLNHTVRASSAVECMNSVLRMHQSRHRTLTQPMLDLKRLYWNTRPFRGGKRKGMCPYEHLGLKLANYNFWTVLQPEIDRVSNEAKRHPKNQPRAA